MTITWTAHYTDGTYLEQRSNGTGPPAIYRDIDRDRLTAFELLKNGQTLVMVDFRNDAKDDPDIGPKRLIWRRRHSQDSRGSHTIVHLVGWQRLVKGRNVQSILYINEDTGLIAMGGQPIDAPMMHAVKLQPQET